MTHYIDKSAVIAEIERRIKAQNKDRDFNYLQIKELESLLSFLNTLETKEVDKEETKWLPSKKQMECLKDMLKYNIGVFDYQKWMEVNTLYDNLTKILDYETNRQK